VAQKKLASGVSFSSWQRDSCGWHWATGYLNKKARSVERAGNIFDTYPKAGHSPGLKTPVI
jgi:hypothetical protein